MPDLSSVIEDAASAPKETSVDGTTVKEHGVGRGIDDHSLHVSETWV